MSQVSEEVGIFLRSGLDWDDRILFLETVYPDYLEGFVAELKSYCFQHNVLTKDELVKRLEKGLVMDDILKYMGLTVQATAFQVTFLDDLMRKLKGPAVRVVDLYQVHHRSPLYFREISVGDISQIDWDAVERRFGPTEGWPEGLREATLSTSQKVAGDLPTELVLTALVFEEEEPEQESALTPPWGEGGSPRASRKRPRSVDDALGDPSAQRAKVDAPGDPSAQRANAENEEVKQEPAQKPRPECYQHYEKSKNDYYKAKALPGRVENLKNLRIAYIKSIKRVLHAHELLVPHHMDIRILEPMIRKIFE